MTQPLKKFFFGSTLPVFIILSLSSCCIFCCLVVLCVAELNRWRFCVISLSSSSSACRSEVQVPAGGKTFW